MSVLHVGAGQTYATINAAIAAASPLDTIEIHGGTYNENVVVSEFALTITNTAGEAVVINGGIQIDANVILTTITSDEPANFTVNATGQAALYLVSNNDGTNVTELTLNSSGNPGSNAVLTGGGQNNVTFTENVFANAAGNSAQLVYVNGEASLGAANASENVSFIDNIFAGDAPAGPLLGIESTGGQITGNNFTGDSPYAALELWGEDNTVTGNDFSGDGPAFMDSSNSYDTNDLINDNTGASDGLIYIDGKVGTYSSIQAAINAADPNDTIYVGDGTYNENIQITKSLTLLSVNGSGSTVIQGSAGGGGLGTIMITPGVNDVTIGNVGEGFHVIGYDVPSAAIEHASIYLQGGHDNITIRGNNVEADGEAALLSEYNASLSDIVIDQNEFSGTTFTGTPVAGGPSVDNSPRPLVFLGTNNGTNNAASDISFTNNDVTGTAGGTTASGGQAGNNLVNIDATDAVITGNDFSGFTTVAQLRSREENPTIEDNEFSNDSGGTTGLQVLDDGTPGTVENNNVLDNPVILTHANGTILGFDTIQEAINAAPASGGVITVAAGTYVEQLVVNGKDVSIVGAGEGQTIIASPEAVDLALSFNDTASGRPSKYAVVAAINGADLNISGLTIDGLDNGQITPPVNGDFVGLYGHNSSINADDVTVTGIRDVVTSGPNAGQPSGVQRTHAVVVSNYAGVNTFTMTDSTVENFQKNAFVLFGAGLTVNVSNNEIHGSGAIGSTAQNGIQLSGGATGVIDGNTIDGFAYTGPANAASSSIILFDADGVVVTNNVITGDTGDNEYGIYMSGVDGATVEGNTLNDLGYAVAADGNYTNPPDVSNNTYNDNGVNFTANPSGTGPFTFVGTEEVDLLGGSANGDTFTGNGGNDEIDGNGGVDTANYADALTAEDFAYDTGTGSWTVNTDTQGSDNLKDVEVVNHAGGNDILLVGGGGYATIQAAIDAADAGDTILIAEGTYDENVVINKDGLTLVGVGNVVIEGTFHTDNTVVGDTNVWLRTTPGYSGNSGTGVMVSADGVTVEGITITGFLNGVAFGDNTDGATFNNVNIDSGVFGYYKTEATDITNLTINNGSISDVYIGIIFAKAQSPAGDGDVAGMEVNGTTFTDITQKGIYVETLYDGLITGITMTNVGQYGGGTAFGAHGNNGAGIDINLKYENDYDNITITDFTMTDVGLSNGNGAPHGNSGAITIKTRDVGSYAGDPAEFDGVVQISDGTINGTSTGIRVGENGQTVNGPAANIQDVTITGAVVQPVVNQTTSQVVVGDGSGNDTVIGNISNAVIDDFTYADTLQAGDFSFAGGTWTVTTDTEGTDVLTDVEVVEHGGANKFLLVGNGGFASIQAAINAAADGDIILVAPGTYDEDLAINKAVTILGAQSGVNGADGGRDAASGTGETTIIGRHDITAGDAVTIDGVRFVNNSSTTGGGAGDPILNVVSDFNHTIENSVFYSEVAGGLVGDRAIMINPSASGTITIEDNYFTGAFTGRFGATDPSSWDRGVWFDGGGVTVLVVTGNTFEYVRTALNLDMTGDATATVTDNNFKSAGSGISGGVDIDGVTLENNTHGNVGTDFNFQNLTGGITFDASKAVDGITPMDGAVLILGSKGGDNITLTEYADIVDGKGGTDTIVYDDLNGAGFSFDKDLNVWYIEAVGGGKDIVQGIEKVTDGTTEVRLVGGGSEYDTIAEAQEGGAFTGPVFVASEPTAPVDTDADANLVAEGAATGTEVGIGASSSDTETGVTYSLIDDAGGRFAIDSTSGIVTVADGSKLDYETSASHEITVRATNAYGATNDSDFTINVGDVGATLGASNSFAPVQEGVTTVGNVIAGGDSAGLTFAILGNLDGSKFTIDASGNLSFVSPPDFENPTDQGADNLYRVTVAVSNTSGQSDIETFDIEVTDKGLTGLVDNDPATASITENAGNGVAINGLDVVGTDGAGSVFDPVFANTTYSLTNNAGGRFTIDATTGQVSTLDGSLIDYETATSHNITVKATNTNNIAEFFSETFTIAVNDEAGSTIIGTSKADTINVTNQSLGTVTGEADTIKGQNGNDNISGLAGNDVIEGGAGNDTLNGEEGNDTLTGGAGLDTYVGGIGDDTFVLSGTNDTKDTFSGGDGTDKIQVTGTANLSLANFDSVGDEIESWAGNNKAVVGSGAINSLDFSNISAVTGLLYVDGGSGNDILKSGSAGLEMRGGAGNDTITGGTGIDTLIGGAGTDVLNGGDGNDIFVVTSTQDTKDTFVGGNGTADTMKVAGTGNVTLAGFSAGNGIEVWQSNGKAVLGTTANDTFDFSGLTSVTGTTGKIQYIDGGSGNDIITGTLVADDLRGGAGNDTLVGGAGNDKLNGGSGNDTLTGNADVDTFVFASGGGQDTVTDYVEGVDKFDLKGVSGIVDFGDLHDRMSEAAGDVVITINATTSLTIENTTIADLVNNQADFILN